MAKAVESPRPPRIAVGRRLPVVVAALLLVVIGVLYYVYVREKRSYLESRNLRLLASGSAQLNLVLGSKLTLVKNFANAESWCKDAQKREWLDEYKRNPRDPSSLDQFLIDVEHVKRDLRPLDPVATESVKQTLRRENDRLILEIEYSSGAKREDEHPLAACPPQPGIRHAVAQVPFDSLLAGIFDQEFFRPFDAVLLVRGDGAVLYQVQPAQAGRIAGLGHIAPVLNTPLAKSTLVPPDLIVANLGALTEEVGLKTERPLAVAALRDQTRQTEITLSGSTYILMSQPYGYDVPLSDPIPSVEEKKDAKPALNQWMICGLVAKPRFMREATAISTSRVAFGVGLLILALCGGAFLKLALLGEHQPITRADVTLAAMATLLGAGVMTLMFVDYLACLRTNEVADGQQRAYAAVLRSRLYQGIDRTLKLAGDLKEWSHAYAKEKYPNEKPLPAIGVGNLPALLKDSKDYKHINRNPWFTSFAFIDSKARHHFRGQVRDGIPPLLTLIGRPYVQEVQNQPWTWHAVDGRAQKFYIDSGRTLTTGKPETVFAVPNDDPQLPVFAITTPFIQFANPLAMPGLTFAIVDARGNVLYHTDQQRIGVENVFAETDHDRRLRAAIFGRHEEFVDARYWGDDQRVLVTPLSDLPWTLLTFREKRLLRTTNVEALAMTLLLFGTYLMMWLLLFLFLGWLRPRYRAPWLWPDRDRADDWMRLRWVCVCTIAAFIVSLIVYAPMVRLAAAWLIPAQFILASCLVLHRGAKRTPYALTMIGWSVATVILLSAALFNNVEEEMLRPAAAIMARLLIFALIAAGALLTLRPLRIQREIRWNEFAFHYVSAGCMAILAVAILPAIGFFQTSYRIEMETLLKYGQLQLADRLQQRTENLAAGAWTSEKLVAQSYTMDEFFESLWCIQKIDHDGRRIGYPCDASSTADSSDLLQSSAVWQRATNDVAEALEDWLPLYSDDSASMRRLHHDAADDGAWYWLRSGRVIALVRRLELNKSAAAKLALPGDRAIVIVSRMPWIIPGSFVPRDAVGDYRRDEEGEQRVRHWPNYRTLADSTQFPWPMRMLCVVAVALLLLAAIFALVEFLARKVFVYDIFVPSWLDTSAPLKPTLGDHLLIVYGSQSLDRLVDAASFTRVSFADLHARDAWSLELTEIDRSPERRTILCSDLDYRLDDRNVARSKVGFIEKLLQIPDRTIVVATQVSPAMLWSASPSQRERWQKALEAFIFLDYRQLDTKPLPSAKRTLGPPETEPPALGRAPWWREVSTKEFWRGEWRTFVARMHRLSDGLGFWPQRSTNASWLLDETSGHPLLESIAAQLPKDAAHEQLVDELLERAHAYYAALWESCSPAERLLMYQIARYGFVNGANRRLLRRLLARRLVRLGGDIMLFNDTFRRFILSRADEVQRESAALDSGESAWDRLRVPLFVVFVVLVVLFLTTQRELANETSAILTGIAAGLPALVKLMGLFVDRRSAVAAKE